MTQNPIPLTPAEQMQLIREAVHAPEIEDAHEAYAVLANYFSRLDMLHDRVLSLESKMHVQERPFVSHAPIIGPLIVYIRNIWNWMSTKWYVLPLLQQQNEFNMASTQTTRELIFAIENLANSVQDVQLRLAELEKKYADQAHQDK